jgi:hypothetical protein
MPIAGGVLLLATRRLFEHERRLVPLRALRAAVSVPILAGLAAGSIFGLLWGGLALIIIIIKIIKHVDMGEIPVAFGFGMFGVIFLFGLVCASLVRPTIGVLTSDAAILRRVIKPGTKP